MESLKPCVKHPCPNFATYQGRCADHQFPPFAKNNRRERLPNDWPQRREYIFHRDNGKCYRCGGLATEVDHIVAGDDHSTDNLAAICNDCHKTKTAHEGNEARNAKPQAWGQFWVEEYLLREEQRKQEESDNNV